MQEWITRIASQLGMNEGTAQNAAGALLRFLQGQAKPEIFNQLLAHLPGADALLKTPPAEGAPAEAGGGDAAGGAGGGGLGGMLGGLGSSLTGGLGAGLTGGLAGLASAAIGSASGGLGTLVNQLSGMGLDVQKVGQLVSSLAGFVRQKGGGEVIDKVLGYVPDLKKLLG